MAILAIASDPADARSRRKRHAVKRAHAVESYNPPYADIVIDAKTGSVLHESNPDAARHPASLTKIMTLYLLFERLESGKITLDTPMDVSQEASIQAPTKLGLKPGDTLKVEDAIKGLVTKSANDAAVVIAEALGGSEDEFARLMTRKAHALGMRHTVYRNASGLPNDEQITTARDQALLGIAIQERFPKFYRYFSLSSFVYRGNAMRNHNHLLGKVEGVDGIKTGYTRASGFNLVTSIKRGARHVVAVVLGGQSAGSRDARMRSLIDNHLAEASAKPAPVMVAEASAATPETIPAAPQLAAAASAPAQLSPPRAADATAAISGGPNAPIQPVKVRTLTVKLVPPKSAPVRTAALAPPTEDSAPAQTAAEAAPAEANSAPAPKHGVLSKIPAVVAAAKEAAVPSAKAEESPARHTTRGGWAIQVGAYEDESEAKQHLSSAKSKMASVLEKAEAYIERTIKGAKTYYRARFAGFDRDQARAACKRLKRSDISCMPLKI
jgi:D-alanyl-D-alanine carboxypeptidase